MTDSDATPSQLLAQTWRTRIPVQITLAQDNISSPTPVGPLYLLAPRQGYLPSLAAQVWPHIQHVLPSLPGGSAQRAWFDHDGLPLKPWLPCGVLFDLTAEDPPRLPWPLTLHYSLNLPDALVSWTDQSAAAAGGAGGSASPAPFSHHTHHQARAQLMNSLKEACHICKGTEGSGAVMRMGSGAQEELWAAVERGDAAAYRACMDALRVVPTQRQGQLPNIPIRLLLRPSPDFQLGSDAMATSQLWERCVATSRPVPAYKTQPPPGRAPAGTSSSAAASGLAGAAPAANNGPALTTLGDLLAMVLPHVFFGPTEATRPGAVAAGAAAALSSLTVAEEPPAQPHAQGQWQQQGPETDGGVAGVAASLASAGMDAEGAQGGAKDCSSANDAGGEGCSGDSRTVSNHPLSDHEPSASHLDQDQPVNALQAVRARSSSGAAQQGVGPDPGPQQLRAADPQEGIGITTLPAAAGGRDASAPGAWPACRVVVNGICPPLQTPVAWLHAAMHAPDYFLYIVVRLD